MIQQSDAVSDALTDPIVHVASVVAAYVSKNSLPAIEMPGLIDAVHKAIKGLQPGASVQAFAPTREPAVAVKKSVHHEFLICLEDGKRLKTLRRYLSRAFDMTPDEYRAKWGLPKDYPMVAPAYSEKRSAMAKASGLGQLRTAAKTAKAGPVETTPATTSKRRGRARKAA